MIWTFELYSLLFFWNLRVVLDGVGSSEWIVGYWTYDPWC